MLLGLFQWIFWVLAIGTALIALMRSEVFSTHSTQRTHRHAGQQFFLFIMAAAFAVAGLVTAAWHMRIGN